MRGLMGYGFLPSLITGGSIVCQGLCITIVWITYIIVSSVAVISRIWPFSPSLSGDIWTLWWTGWVVHHLTRDSKACWTTVVYFHLSITKICLMGGVGETAFANLKITAVELTILGFVCVHIHGWSGTGGPLWGLLLLKIWLLMKIWILPPPPEYKVLASKERRVRITIT